MIDDIDDLLGDEDDYLNDDRGDVTPKIPIKKSKAVKLSKPITKVAKRSREEANIKKPKAKDQSAKKKGTIKKSK